MREPLTLDTNEQAAAMSDRPHPNDYWIVSNYYYKPWPTPAAAYAAREKLAAQFAGKRFHVIHCKRRVGPSNSGVIIADLLAALKALAPFDLPDHPMPEYHAAHAAIAKAERG